MTITYQVLYWRDIPSQVRLRSGRERQSRPLSGRFQEAIDEAAMRARATSNDDYLEDWRTSDWQPGEGEAGQIADRLVSEIEAGYPPARLAALIKNLGYEGSPPTPLTKGGEGGIGWEDF